MGDSHGINPTSYVLPPGCRFFPSEQQLLCYYLTRKNSLNDDNDSNCHGCDVIKELDFYNYDPFELPDVACYTYGYKGRKRHWFCYTLVRVVKESNRGGSRRTRHGFWRRKGRVRDVLGERGSNVVLGRRTKFVFYLGNLAKSATRTDLVMYEYALIDNLKASFVLCRVFLKSRGNCMSENGLISCGDESVSTVRHIGIQHDGVSLSDSFRSRGHSDYSAEGNHQSRYPDRILSELAEQAVTTPASLSNVGLQSGIQSRELVRFYDTACRDETYTGAASDQYLPSIVEEDFIELNDLICPLSGTDSLG